MKLFRLFKYEYCLSLSIFTAGDELQWGDEIHWPTSTALPPIMVSVPIMVTPSRSNKSKCHGEENMK